MARENAKAIAILEQAFDGESTADLLQQLAELYLIAEAWDDAGRVLEQGVPKASGEQRDRMLITLGIVRYRQRRLEQARLAFEQAGDGTGSPDQAVQWLQYLDYLEAAD